MKPPTPLPEAGQGPWFNENEHRWWVVADSAADALREVDRCAELPKYFGWRAIVEPCVIRWFYDEDEGEWGVDEDRYADEETNVEAWRITVENA